MLLACVFTLPEQVSETEIFVSKFFLSKIPKKNYLRIGISRKVLGSGGSYFPRKILTPRGTSIAFSHWDKIFKILINTEARLHFAYTIKNMTDNATGKN